MIESSSNLRQCAQNPTGDQKACNRMYISCLYEPVGHALIFKAVSKHRFNLNRTCMQGTAKSKLIKEAKKKKEHCTNETAFKESAPRLHNITDLTVITVYAAGLIIRMALAPALCNTESKGN